MCKLVYFNSESPLFLTLFLSEIEETDKVYNSFDVIRNILCTVIYPIVGFPLFHGIEDDYIFQQHPFEPTMELWSMAAKGFLEIFIT